MTWRTPAIARALDALEAHVRGTYAPLGIIVAGSIVRGEAGPTSDLDVFVIHDQPWRLRDQRRIEGIPVELFVNPPAQIRRYFASEHAAGRPCTAHMFATGVALPPVAPIVATLVAEARDWLGRPLEPVQLEGKRYAVVDALDDARDVIGHDPAAASLLLAEVVHGTIAYAFWRAGRFQPRRKDAVDALGALDPAAAALVQRWSSSSGADALAVVEALARHVLGVETFFAWSSEPDPVELE